MSKSLLFALSISVALVGCANRTISRTANSGLVAQISAPRTNVIGRSFVVKVALINKTQTNCCIRGLGSRYEWLHLAEKNGNPVPSGSPYNVSPGPDTPEHFIVLGPGKKIQSKIYCEWVKRDYVDTLISGLHEFSLKEGDFSMSFLKRTSAVSHLKTKENKWIAFGEAFTSPLYTNSIQSMPVDIHFIKRE